MQRLKILRLGRGKRKENKKKEKGKERYELVK